MELLVASPRAQLRYSRQGRNLTDEFLFIFGSPSSSSLLLSNLELSGTQSLWALNTSPPRNRYARQGRNLPHEFLFAFGTPQRRSFRGANPTLLNHTPRTLNRNRKSEPVEWSRSNHVEWSKSDPVEMYTRGVEP